MTTLDRIDDLQKLAMFIENVQIAREPMMDSGGHIKISLKCKSWQQKKEIIDQKHRIEMDIAASKPCICVVGSAANCRYAGRKKTRTAQFIADGDLETDKITSNNSNCGRVQIKKKQSTGSTLDFDLFLITPSTMKDVSNVKKGWILRKALRVTNSKLDLCLTTIFFSSRNTNKWSPGQGVHSELKQHFLESLQQGDTLEKITCLPVCVWHSLSTDNEERRCEMSVMWMATDITLSNNNMEKRTFPVDYCTDRVAEHRHSSGSLPVASIKQNKCVLRTFDCDAQENWKVFFECKDFPELAQYIKNLIK